LINGFKERLSYEFQRGLSNQPSLFVIAPTILSCPDLAASRLSIVHGALQLCEEKSVIWYQNDASELT
jgi:hypothetical protein